MSGSNASSPPEGNLSQFGGSQTAASLSRSAPTPRALSRSVGLIVGPFVVGKFITDDSRLPIRVCITDAWPNTTSATQGVVASGEAEIKSHRSPADRIEKAVSPSNGVVSFGAARLEMLLDLGLIEKGMPSSICSTNLWSVLGMLFGHASLLLGASCDAVVQSGFVATASKDAHAQQD
jgi:hypothetical protein